LSRAGAKGLEVYAQDGRHGRAVEAMLANDPPPWRGLVKLLQGGVQQLGFNAATMVRQRMESHEGWWYSRQETRHLQTGASRTKPPSPRPRAQENSLRQRGLPPLKKTAHGAVAL
jgi:hypothetical protein